jgi:hypothetical protein
MPRNGFATSSSTGSSPMAKSTPDQLSMFALMNLPDLPSVISSPASVDGPSLCDLPDGTTLDLFGQALALASHSRSSASRMDTATHGTFGRLGFGSSASDNLQRCLANRLRARLAGSDLCEVIWRRWVTPWGRCLSRPHARGDHWRDRYWFVGHRIEPGLEGHAGYVDLAWPETQAPGSIAAPSPRRDPDPIRNGHGFDWYLVDGKARRVKSGVLLLAPRLPARVDQLRAIGNAIHPRPAAAFIGAAMRCQP